MEQSDRHLADFFAILRNSLFNTPLPCVDTQNAPEIWQELKHHAIQNLAVDTMAQLDPGNQLLYIQSAAKGCAHWYALMEVQQEIMQVLETAGIPCAVLKGAAADFYYPHPLNRNMGDIDLLVKPQDFQRASQLLMDSGCQMHDNRNPRHMELRKNGIPIELHRHFATLSHIQRAETLDQILFDALDRAQKVSMEGYEFFMLPDLENGLVQMEHINSHMESGLGLRQIIDWMLYADKVLTDDVWFQQFSELFRRVGLEKLTLTVTHMCQLYLGLRSDITWCQLSDPQLCHRLMAHTLQQGNFGRKQERRTRGAVQVLSIMESDLNFFQLLQRHGCYNWKALKKHTWLKPFAWLYQLCRYIRKGLRGKKPVAAFLRAFRKKKSNSDLLEALGVQRKNHALEYDP